ncbi:conserved hypothetical protein. Putative dynein light intermediate chain [Geotrichum candidum]|uniref:Dynein light intermediate chain n=1 Tax=Geotrichum candidum TaxID=1173061 RepID=A0A0J9YHC5_GEOCN|nr:conserved hypothetical protein. Putative dynein light intermediate chain [Geotrichum candidum]
MPTTTTTTSTTAATGTANNEIWSSMLKAVGGVNTTPSGTLLLVSRQQATQTDLITQLQASALRATGGSAASDSIAGRLNNSSINGGSSGSADLPAIANSFLLGYTFVETRDYDDKLAHLDVYTAVGDADDRAYGTLLRDFFEKQYQSPTNDARANSSDSSSSPGSGSNTGKKNGKFAVGLVVDWNEDVREFARFVSDWLRLLRRSVAGLAGVDAVEDELKHRLQTYIAPGGTTSAATAATTSSGTGSGDSGVVELPLEEGQYEVPLGFDLVLIAANAQNVLPETIGAGSRSGDTPFSDDLVDYIQQVLRTIALTHGASLIYAPATSHLEEGATNRDALATLVGERLQIPLVGEIGAAVPSVVDQSGILVPAGWDSVGKILALRDGFPDSIREAWAKSIAIDADENAKAVATSEDVFDNSEELEQDEAVEIYERTITKLHPSSRNARGSRGANDSSGPDLDDTKGGEKVTPRIDFQAFLAGQYEILESRIKKEQETSPYKRNARQFGGFSGNSAGASALSGIQGVPNENDINIGGIQVEGVEEVLRRLKIQETIMNKEPTTPRLGNSTPDMSSLNIMPNNGNSNINNIDGLSGHAQGIPKQPSLNLSTAAHNNITSSGSHIGLSGVSSTTTRFSGIDATSSASTSLGNNTTAGSTMESGSIGDRPNSQTEVLSNFFQNILDRNRQ